MHILTNKGLRKAEQVEIRNILAKLHNDLSEIDRKNDPTNDAFPSPYLYGFVNGIRAAQTEIRNILDTYDDPDFIRDFLDGKEDR